MAALDASAKFSPIYRPRNACPACGSTTACPENCALVLLDRYSSSTESLSIGNGQYESEVHDDDEIGKDDEDWEDAKLNWNRNGEKDRFDGQKKESLSTDKVNTAQQGRPEASAEKEPKVKPSAAATVNAPRR